jgi:hypothetical protein
VLGNTRLLYETDSAPTVFVEVSELDLTDCLVLKA